MRRLVNSCNSALLSALPFNVAHTNELCEMIEEYNTLVALLIQKHEVGLHEELSTIVDHIRQTEAGQGILFLEQQHVVGPLRMFGAYAKADPSR